MASWRQSVLNPLSLLTLSNATSNETSSRQSVSLRSKFKKHKQEVTVSPCILPNEILFQIFGYLQHRYSGTLAAVSQSSRRLQDVAYPFLYEEYLLPYNESFYEPALRPFKSKVENGTQFIKCLYFVPGASDETAYSSKSFDLGRISDLFHGNNDLSVVLKKLNRGQIQTIFFDQDVPTVLSESWTWEYLALTQSNINSLTINFTNVFAFSSLSPMHSLQHLNISGRLKASDISHLWAFVHASAQTLKSLHLGFHWDPELRLSSMFPEPIQTSLQAFVANLDVPKLSSLQTLEMWGFQDMRFFLPYISRVIDPLKLESLAIHDFISEHPEESICCATIRGFTNLTSLEIIEADATLLEKVVPYLSPLHKLVVELGFSPRLPNKSWVTKHRESLRRFVFGANPGMTFKALNEDYEFWKWPELLELSIETESAMWSQEKCLKLPQKLKLLHLAKIPNFTSFLNHPARHAMSDAELQRGFRDICLRDIPVLVFPGQDPQIVFPLRVLMYGVGTWSKSPRLPFYFTPVYGKFRYPKLEYFKSASVLDLHAEYPELELLGRQMETRRWSSVTEDAPPG